MTEARTRRPRSRPRASEALLAFVRSVRDAPRSREEHESYDVWSLRSLEGAERDEAQRLLVEVLHGAKPDVRAVDALSVLGGAGALEALAQALPGLLARGHVGAAILAAEVLHRERRITNAEALEAATAALAHGAIHHQTRAAKLLVRASGKKAWRVLLDVIAEMPLGVVRAELYERCLDALGVAPADRAPPSNLAALGELVGGHSHAGRDAALAELAPIAEALGSGRSGARAGVRRGKGKRAARAARDRLRRGEPADLDALSEEGRAYLGAWILGQLPTDVAAHYEALATLRPPLTPTVLNDLATWPDEELGGARPFLTRALRRRA